MLHEVFTKRCYACCYWENDAILDLVLTTPFLDDKAG